MADWDFDTIKSRIEHIADLSRDACESDAPAKYHKGLETELKALRAWVDVDEKQRAPAELDELRAIVAQLEHDVTELQGNARSGDARATEIARPGPGATWRQ